MKNIVIPDCTQRRLIFYLAMEEYVARYVDDDAFFVWQSDPTVIIGRNQVLENEVNLPFCKDNDIQVYRRKSGGGCVYSDKGNVMVSYVSSRGNVSDVFDKYLSALSESLQRLGVPAMRSGRNDILVEGRKVSGNAFQMMPDRCVVHGTLLYSTDIDVLTEAIRPPLEKLNRHGVESVRQRVLNIAEYVEAKGLKDARLHSVEALKTYLVETFCVGEIILSDEDIRKIEIIENEYQLL